MTLVRALVPVFVAFFRNIGFPVISRAQENPYWVAYDHYLEEPGSLEIGCFSTFSTERRGNVFDSYWMEIEYGATAWWTTEFFYLDGQTTFGDSTVFTGIRWENRFRPLQREHFINPIWYVEYEHKSSADKLLKEVEGHDVEADFLSPNTVARREIVGLHDTSHYAAAVLGGNLPSGWSLRISSSFGLNDQSHQFLLRWGLSREISGFGAMVDKLFRGRP